MKFSLLDWCTVQFVTHLNAKQEWLYNNNGKPNPNNVVLVLYTIYDSNFFRFIFITSCTMILVHPREFLDGRCIKIAPLVKFQITIFTVGKIRQVAVDKILNLRPQLIKQRIHTLQEDNDLAVHISGYAVSIILF